MCGAFCERYFFVFFVFHHRNIQRLDDSFVIPCMIIFATIVVMAILCASVMSTVSAGDSKLDLGYALISVFD